MCVLVCVLVCVCVCVCVWATAFEALVWWYILTISRSSSSVTATESMSRSYIEKMVIWLNRHQFTLVFTCLRSGHKLGQGYFKVKL